MTCIAVSKSGSLSYRSFRVGVSVEESTWRSSRWWFESRIPMLWGKESKPSKRGDTSHWNHQAPITHQNNVQICTAYNLWWAGMWWIELEIAHFHSFPDWLTKRLNKFTWKHWQGWNQTLKKNMRVFAFLGLFFCRDGDEIIQLYPYLWYQQYTIYSIQFNLTCRSSPQT